MEKKLPYERVAISSLTFDPRNARKHDKKNIKAIKDSLVKFGQQRTIVVTKDDVIIAGNGTVQAAKELGWDTIDITRSQLTGEDAIAFGLVDNRSSELAAWDDDNLKELLTELDQTGWDLEGLGWDNDDLKDILDKSEGTEGLTDEDAVPEVEQNAFGVKLGDIWQLGNHRLMCGDSTDKATVEKLMNGEKADMVFTDPPYGIDLDTKDNKTSRDINKSSSAAFLKRERPRAFSNLKEKNYSKIIQDHERFNTKYIEELIQESNDCLIFGINYFPEIISKNWPGSCQVWDKRDAGRLAEMHGSHFELFWTKNKAQQKVYRCTWCGAFGMGNNYNESRVHPTQKPMKLLEAIFDDFKFDFCIDPFLGSGSTLIACEKTGRKCYGMELDPHYCSVIIKRWQDFTGKEAKLIESAK